MRFFVLLAPEDKDFKTQLYLPALFCTKARGDFSVEAVVVTSLGRWMIKTGNKRGIFYFHGEEWVKFVNEHDLKERSLVLFEHHGSFLFHASIFDASACEKLEFQPHYSQHISSDENAEEEKPTVPLRSFANPTFRRILRASSGCGVQKTDFCCLYLPTKIWKENNLQEKTEAMLRVRGLETKEWKGKLVFYPDYEFGRDRLLVRRGWYEFVSANNIKKGDNCSFEIVTDATEFGYSNKAIIIIVTKGN